jgi:hypothetical protein
MNNTVFCDVTLLTVEEEEEEEEEEGACSPLQKICKFLPDYVATARNVADKTVPIHLRHKRLYRTFCH